MSCTSCAKRRAKLKALREEKKLKRQGLQAAAIGAVLVASETVGKVLGIGEGTENGRESDISKDETDQAQ